MFKHIDRFNVWFDTVKEPWRFLFLIAYTVVVAISLSTNVLFFLGVLLSILLAVTVLRRMT